MRDVWFYTAILKYFHFEEIIEYSCNMGWMHEECMRLDTAAVAVTRVTMEVTKYSFCRFSFICLPKSVLMVYSSVQYRNS